MIEKSVIFLKTAAPLCGVVALALCLRVSVVEVYRLPEKGMMPTLLEGDRLLANKLAYGLRIPFVKKPLARWGRPGRGDVLVFRTPFDKNSLSVRRVVALPGDRIFFENDRLYLNEREVKRYLPPSAFQGMREEDFSKGWIGPDKSHFTHYVENLFGTSYSVLLKKNRKGYLIFGPYLIPDGYYFVLGDHRDFTRDSRTWSLNVQKAKGEVSFSRSKRGSPVFIPKGTVVRTTHPQLPEYFETLNPAHLTGRSVNVEVEAKRGGLNGNVKAYQINHIEDRRLSFLKVRNKKPFQGGKSDNLVKEEDVLGRIARVGWSCQAALSFVDFICHPGTIRWRRNFKSLSP